MLLWAVWPREIRACNGAMRQIVKDDDQLDLALLRAMVDNAVDGIIAIDERGVIRLVNPAAEKLFDHPASSMVGHNVTMLMPEPYRGEHDGYLHNYLTTGVKKIIGSGREVRGLRKDGTTFPMYLSVAEVRHGHARLFTGIVHDLSKIRSAEEQIAHLERQHILILNAIGEGIFGLDAEGRITFANPAAEEMLGWVSMEIIGRSIQTIWPVPDAPRLLLRDAAAAGECYHTVDARFQRRDGTTMPVEFHCTLLRQQGRATGAVLSFLDITERKQAEEQLRRERDRAQSYLDIAGVMIIALDRDQRVTLVNRKACEILACRPEELLGGCWLDHIVAPGERELVRSDFSGLLEGGQKGVSYFEYPVLCRDGQARLTAWHNALVSDADGAVPLMAEEKTMFRVSKIV